MESNGTLRNKRTSLSVATFFGMIDLLTSCTGGEIPPVRELRNDEATANLATATATVIATVTILPA